MRAKIALSIILPIAALATPSRTAKLRFVSLDKPMAITAQRNVPPNIAFQEIQTRDLQINEWDVLSSSVGTKLSTLQVRKTAHPIEKRVVLEPIEIKKQVEVLQSVVTTEDVGEDWTLGLSRAQRLRLDEAQRRHNLLDETSPTDVDEQEYLASTRSETKPPVAKGPIENERREISILGQIELAGVGLTNEHYIEVRRLVEGVLQEKGNIDLNKGSYSINLSGVQGTILARMKNKKGRTIGEASYRLSRLNLKQGKNLGPKMTLQPRVDFTGAAANVYSEAKNRIAPAETRATIFKGEIDELVKRDGQIHIENIAKNSTSVIRLAAPGFLQTNILAQAGEKFNAPLFPEKMIQALKDIVSDQKQYSLSQQHSPVVWGKVLLEGKPLAGAVVQIESDDSAITIYFNELLLPDPKLKSTSSNGIYAIINMAEGPQAILATRGDAYYAHYNVIAEMNAVSIANLESTLQTENTIVKVFDAFTGEPIAGELLMQSAPETINVGDDGLASVVLPQISRQSILQAYPQKDYTEAAYLYNDNDSAVLVPMLKSSWLNEIKQSMKLDDSPNAGVIVGFVGNENFEVDLAGEEKNAKRNIVYFDSLGLPSKNNQGIIGGGFIIYNVPPDTHEVIVYGLETQQIFGKTVSVESSQLTILNFQE